MRPEVAGLLSQFQSIKSHVQHLLVYLEAFFQIDSILKEYSNAKQIYDSTFKKEAKIDLRDLSHSFSSFDKKSLLIEVDIECEKAIGALRSIVTPLSKGDLDKITHLKKELKTVSEHLSDINYEKNLTNAIEEYECGHILASALISGRVIIYALAQLPGGPTEEKIKLLTEEGRIEKTKDNVYESFILKADRKARNFSSHNIKVFPTASEAISLIGDAIGILRFLAE